MPALLQPAETNTRATRAAVLLAALAMAAAGAGAATGNRPPATLPLGRAVSILSPRFFPTWQARNVAFPFVLHDRATGLYRMYYAGSGAAQLNESAYDQWMTGLATSRDLRSWTLPDDYQPVLSAHRFRQGEVVAPARTAEFDSLAAFGASVLREGASFRMWYTGWNGDHAPTNDGRAQPIHFRIGSAVSTDGRRWTKQPGQAGAGAVLAPGESGAPDSRSTGQPYVIKTREGYRMWYEADDGRTWRICSARSPDGLRWTKEGIAIEPGGAGAGDELGARNPVVLRRRGRLELWYQGRSRSAPAFHLLRAASDDGISWTRLPGEVALHPDPPPRGEEALHADSVLVQPGGACQVFFAKQSVTSRKGAWGEGRAHSFHIFVELVDP